jgi:hypothetical protein
MKVVPQIVNAKYDSATSIFSVYAEQPCEIQVKMAAEAVNASVRGLFKDI